MALMLILLKVIKLLARCAYEGEKLKLLDCETITLAPTDYVITDGNHPIALAGIIGGIATSISNDTLSIFLESGNFDATIIRHTSNRIKKRTESSARFEKSLDPNQNTQAILRYVKLLTDYKINYQASDAIVSVGPLIQESIITVYHELFVNKIGIHVDSGTIEEILTKLGFGFQAEYNDSKTIYKITVPTYRATKDIKLPEDIVEEVARFIGYTNVKEQAPAGAMLPFDTSAVKRVREIKHHMAFGLNMHEAQTYAFYDEEFLKLLSFNPTDALHIANPLSEHWQRLVTSLIPNLLKCVYINQVKQESLRFFEFNRVWFVGLEPVESKELAAIFYEHKKPVDFYECKAFVDSLFTRIGIKITWRKPTKDVDPWYNKYQTAELVYQDQIMGMAGKISQPFINSILPGDAFIVELNGDFLVTVKSKVHEFKPLPKYQEVHLDISMLVPQQITVTQLQETVSQADKRIKNVELVDFFEKKEWAGKKSVTLRFVIYDEHKTLTKEEIDSVWNKVVEKVESQGAAIR